MMQNFDDLFNHHFGDSYDVKQLWLVCCDGSPSTAFDNEERAQNFVARRKQDPHFQLQHSWTIITVPYNVGAST